MVPAPFVVILDANVLYPFTLRDTLLRAAEQDFYQMHWTQQILDEASRNLVKNGVMPEEQAQSLRKQMDRLFPEADVTGYEPLIAAMKNDEKDRHVAAAAVQAGAQTIVTFNLKDFRDLPPGIEAQSPDEFLCNLFDLDPEAFVELLVNQADDLEKPPQTLDEVLSTLAKTVPEFIAAVREHMREAVVDPLPVFDDEKN